MLRILNRTPLWERSDRIMRQDSPRHTYNGLSVSYPCWILNESKVLAPLREASYLPVMSLVVHADAPLIPSFGPLPYRGLLLKKFSSPPL